MFEPSQCCTEKIGHRGKNGLRIKIIHLIPVGVKIVIMNYIYLKKYLSNYSAFSGHILVSFEEI